MAVVVILFLWIILKVSKTDHFGTFKVSLSHQELSNDHMISSVRQFWSFDSNDGSSGNFANFKVEADPLDAFKCTSNLAWWMVLGNVTNKLRWQNRCSTFFEKWGLWCSILVSNGLCQQWWNWWCQRSWKFGEISSLNKKCNSCIIILGFWVSIMFFPSSFISILHSNKIFCHFILLLSYFGHLTSSIIATTWLVEITIIQHGHQIVCSSYCWLSVGCLSSFLMQPEGLCHVNNIT